MRTQIALAALGAASLATVAAADTINVPADQPTINDAVAAARDGDTIVVRKGRYAESVLLDGFDGLTLRAKGKVIIDPAFGPGMVAQNCSGVMVQGLWVEDASIGFVIDTCTDVELRRFRVRQVDGHGVQVRASSDVDLLGGKIEDCGEDGVAFGYWEPGQGLAGGTVAKVKAFRCGDDGFDVAGSDVTLLGCKATDCGDDGFESDDGGAGPVRFEKCKASDVGDEGFELGSPATVCVRCKAIDTEDDGYDIEADDCVLERCTAKKCEEAGFSIDSIDNAQITGCKAIKCERQGFDFWGATNARLEKCKAMKTEREGFHLDGNTRGCVLTKCKGKKSGDADLNDESDGSNVFEKSKFKKT